VQIIEFAEELADQAREKASASWADRAGTSDSISSKNKNAG